MAMWEIHDHLPRWVAASLVGAQIQCPLKGNIFDTADTGLVIKARIEACREEKPNGWGHPFFQVTAIEI